MKIPQVYDFRLDDIGEDVLHQARLTVADHSESTEDARLIMMALGLIQKGESDVAGPDSRE